MNPYTNNISSTIYVCDIFEFIHIQQYKDKAFLHQKYAVEGLSTKQIADLVASSRSTISKYLRLHGIKIRTEDEATCHRKGQLKYGERIQNGKIKKNLSEIQIITKIIKLRSEGWSYWKIAEFLNGWEVPTKNKNSRWHPTTVMKILSRNTSRQIPSTKH